MYLKFFEFRAVQKVGKQHFHDAVATRKPRNSIGEQSRGPLTLAFNNQILVSQPSIPHFFAKDFFQLFYNISRAQFHQFLGPAIALNHKICNVGSLLLDNLAF